MKPTSLAGRLALATASIVLLCGIARADVIYLSSGGVVKGAIVQETNDSVTVKTTGGSTSIIPKSEIERIEKGSSPDAMYRERLAKIPLGDAEGHYQLGLWLKKINCKDLAKDEFAKTILLDPEHKFARDELGYIRDQAGRWVLPHETSGDEPTVVAPAAPAPEEEPKAPEIKLDANGYSPELASTLADLSSTNAFARKAAFDKLETTISAESDRLVNVLAGPFNKTREKMGQAIAKASPGADATLAKVPSEGTKDDAVRAELKTHIDAYVEKQVRPAVIATVRHFERTAASEVSRSAVFFRTFIKDYRTDSAMKRREKALTAWVEARDVAIKTIFDLAIYPDENHGRVGQPIVDEKVDAVRAAWQFLDPQVQRDLSRYIAMSETEAKRSIQILLEARAREKNAAAYLESKGEKCEAFVDATLLDESLVLYRAGMIDEALAVGEKLTGYEKELLKRLRDQRVLDYNDAFKTVAPKSGKQPTGTEMQQVAITNEYRIMMGRHALEIDPRLIESARGHSNEMTRLGYFDHESPVGANKFPSDRMKNAGYEGAWGENISLGSEAPKATHLAWYNSSGHHRNILGPQWFAMGSGQDGRHWTQNFGGAAPQLKR
jgi:uncharacterized protein YkwD